MTDPDPDFEFETDRERELWMASVARLREHAEDPQAEQGLDRLAAGILAEHRASARSTRRTGVRVIGAWLAVAATIAVIVVATQSEDEQVAIEPEHALPTPSEPISNSPSVEAPTERRGPPLEQAGLLTFNLGAVEQTTEVVAAIEPGATIQPGATLSTGVGGETCLRWTAPFAVVCVEANARVELLAAEPSTRRLHLHAGRLVAVLDPLAPGQRFEVVTSLGSVAAIGTVFVVEVDEVAIAASVFEGEVEVRERDRVRSLLAGSALRLESDSEPTPLDPEVRARAETLSARAELWRGPIEPPATKPSKPLAPVEKSAAELARLAQQHRMARNYPETARFYRELIDRYPESPEAANVPVRLGDLLLKTGDHEGALAAYDRYLERGGGLSPEARFGRIKALRALGRDQDEADAIAEFLREHGDDYRVGELEQRLAELE